MRASIYCPYCHQHTALRLANAKYTSETGRTKYTRALWEQDNWHDWWIGICNSCQSPVLVLNDGERIYPSPLPSPTDQRIPKDLATDLNEAKMCFANEYFRACAVLGRRCVQMACQLKGAKKKELVGQIAELREQGIITKDIEEWATVVRWIGNDAAHPNKDKVTRDDAHGCLTLAEQFLHVIFVTPAIAKARRVARKK